MARYAVVVAGGKGQRMERELPKQFLPLKGLPVLMHTLSLFQASDAVVLVLPSVHHEYWADLCRTYQFDMPHQVVSGGESRFHSVRNGLIYFDEHMGFKEADVVAVHDGVRPLASQELIKQGYEWAERTEAVIPIRPVVESLRQLDLQAGSHALDRSQYVHVQTPQVFRALPLVDAYKRAYQEYFTDDASVWEDAYPSRPITLIESNPENIKITIPLDLRLAELLLP